MKLPYYVVNAFTDKPFSGNPAGVCPLESWPSDELMQKIAAENNLSETAFFAKEGDAYRLRWFAPAAEVDLCGHATLASAFVLYEFLGHKAPKVVFNTKSGSLSVEKKDGRFVLDFPALALEPVAAPEALVKGLGAKPRELFRSMDYVAVYDSPETVRDMKPDLEALKRLDARGVVVTAPGRDCDYVLRCFGPKFGIAEDPATGSAQCALAPYWAMRFGKSSLSVRQLSKRGGDFRVELAGDRTKISGQAAAYSKGEISIVL